RRDEVSGMQWTEIDFNTGIWTIPKERTKNGVAHIVHLSPQALDILRPALLGAAFSSRPSGFVFTTTGKTGINGYSDAKDKLDALLPQDIPAWRIHDLRRTASTLMGERGFAAPHIIEKILNHAPEKLKKIYQRSQNLPERKRALEVWGKYVDRLAA